MTERNQLIDSLRGLAILVMILTHVTAFFPGDKIAYAFWNWSHFAVPIFVFCSTYLFLQKSSDKPLQFFSYLKKRILRLVIPYYIFLFFFVISLLLFLPKIVTAKYLWQSVLLIGGVDINWLVLLFIYITVILPIFVWMQKKAKICFWLYFLACLAGSLLLLFYQLPVSYKFIMWLPWSLVLYFTWFYIRYEHKKKILALFLLLFICLFIASHSILNTINHSLVLIHNKYPPNIFYLSYGLSLLLFFSLSQKYLFSNSYLQKILHFFSRFSYSIYFLHYIILSILALYIKQFHLNWLVLFLMVLATTTFLQKLFVWVRIKLSL